MNTRQLKQSAMADFMQSLEQLNELWDSDLDMAGWPEKTSNPAPVKDERDGAAKAHRQDNPSADSGDVPQQSTPQ